MLTVDELTILSFYAGDGQSRDSVIKIMVESLPFVPEPEIQDVMQSIIRKITALSQTAFNQIDYSDILENAKN